MSTKDAAFERTVQQEVSRLEAHHPSPDDIPGCLSLFDDFLSCNVFRSQVKSLYRYGERPNCSPKFEEFKYCMSIKGMHPEERRMAWIQRRAEWWATRRLTCSSEDVWDIRTEPLVNFPKPIPDGPVEHSTPE
ncbi:hypothetical protein BDN72DRAFT_789983 [Pluteus cervinus]|uniref:Uncharacterized protein n=1 Tax=Pluteus cervinus TaxID=181527 RepID=A0ACD3B8N6_9AGAR|nr:hypothetical protein BDN72DRAFT_789983 [Pluteus cervinus]